MRNMMIGLLSCLAVALGVSCMAVTPAVCVNVVDHGAQADGKADDTAAIQKALDAAAGGGGICYLPAVISVSC